MNIESTRFGTLDVKEEQLIRFPQGIPGFPEEKSFVYLQEDRESPFSFLQSATEANLTFLLVEPFQFFSDYEFILEDEVTEELGLTPDNFPDVFLIATVKEKLADMTVNLLAPLIINSCSQLGRQVILEKPEYSIRHKLFPDGLELAEIRGGE
ncbi:MAG TPA: flagellar assembly protein FliW [Desulfitobacteriaceae bacterium]|nr:flagellar assembly protein FliW [Desulfitobacteriaceae bacterium]